MKIFEKAKTLHITAGVSNGTMVYPMSFIGLLRLIKESGLKTIVIKSGRYVQKGDKSWMVNEWIRNGHKLVELYRKEKYYVRWENHEQLVWFYIERKE